MRVHPSLLGDWGTPHHARGTVASLSGYRCNSPGLRASRDRRVANARGVASTFGPNGSRLYWDLPLRESLALVRNICGVPGALDHENPRPCAEVLGANIVAIDDRALAAYPVRR